MNVTMTLGELADTVERLQASAWGAGEKIEKIYELPVFVRHHGASLAIEGLASTFGREGDSAVEIITAGPRERSGDEG